MKNSFFYNTQDIKRMKELIRTGEPLVQIAEREHASFNAPQKGFYNKLLKVSKHTNKIRQWEGKRPTRRKSLPVKPIELEMPKGFSFEGTPKKVTFSTDHFRVYF